MTEDHASFDFLVVGAGSAGCVLAARLSADPAVSVGLIEAGGEPADPAIADPLAWPALQGSSIDWSYRTVAQSACAGRTHPWPRGRIVGGSSAINAMAHVRGHPDDFDRWGCRGWGYADLLPYFKRSEDSPFAPSSHHASGGPLHLLVPTEPHPITVAYMRAAIERGLAPTPDHNGARMTGPTLNTLTIRNGRRQTAADAYLGPDIRARPNLTILTGLLVDRLLFARQGHCAGVATAGDTDPRRLSAGSAVILAAGAIGSPAILMRSGVGRPDALATLGIATVHPLPGVGRNLHDHLLSGGNVYASRRPVQPSRYQHSESLTYIDGHAGGAAPQLVLACVIAPVATDAFAAPEPGSAYTIMFGFTHPRSRGSLRLASSDPAVPPVIDPAYLSEPADRLHLEEAMDWARAIGGSSALSEWRDTELLPRAADLSSASARAAFLEKSAATHHHPVGTCRMGTDTDAVVGPDLRIRGVDRLYVVDGSVIPAITTGPINAAIIAIAERASDLISGQPVLAPFDPRDDPSSP